MVEGRLNNQLIHFDQAHLDTQSSVERSFADTLCVFYSGIWNVVSLSQTEKHIFDSVERLQDLVTGIAQEGSLLGFWELQRALSDLALSQLPLSTGTVRVAWLSYCVSRNEKLAHGSFLEQTEIFKSYKIKSDEFVELLACFLCQVFHKRIPENETLVDAINRYLTRRVDSDFFKNVYRNYLLDPDEVMSRSSNTPKVPLRAVPFEKLRHPQTDQVAEYLWARRRSRKRPRFFVKNVSNQMIRVKLIAPDQEGVSLSRNSRGLAPGACVSVFSENKMPEGLIEVQAEARSGLRTQSQLII